MRHVPCLLWTLLAAGGAAQSVILPSAVTAAAPPSYALDATTFQSPESRSQLVYDVNDIGPGAAVWTSMQFRAPAPATVPIPNQPGIGGQYFYDQGIFFDPAANSFGVVTSWSNRWRVGTLQGSPGATLTTGGITGGRTAPAGTLHVGLVTTIQLN